MGSSVAGLLVCGCAFVLLGGAAARRRRKAALTAAPPPENNPEGGAVVEVANPGNTRKRIVWQASLQRSSMRDLVTRTDTIKGLLTKVDDAVPIAGPTNGGVNPLFSGDKEDGASPFSSRQPVRSVMMDLGPTQARGGGRIKLKSAGLAVVATGEFSRESPMRMARARKPAVSSMRDLLAQVPSPTPVKLDYTRDEEDAAGHENPMRAAVPPSSVPHDTHHNVPLEFGTVPGRGAVGGGGVGGANPNARHHMTDVPLGTGLAVSGRGDSAHDNPMASSAGAGGADDVPLYTGTRLAQGGGSGSGGGAWEEGGDDVDGGLRWSNPMRGPRLEPPPVLGSRPVGTMGNALLNRLAQGRAAARAVLFAVSIKPPPLSATPGVHSPPAKRSSMRHLLSMDEPAGGTAPRAAPILQAEPVVSPTSLQRAATTRPMLRGGGGQRASVRNILREASASAYVAGAADDVEPETEL